MGLELETPHPPPPPVCAQIQILLCSFNLFLSIRIDHIPVVIICVTCLYHILHTA